jgi:hypothetical protein
MSPSVEWKDEILARLDEKAKEYDFPILNNAYFTYLAIDLRAYRSDTEWLILFQLVALRDGDVLTMLDAYGNQLEKNGLQYAFTTVPKAEGITVEEDNGSRVVRLEIFGHVHDLRFDSTDWKTVGSDFDGEGGAAHVLRLAVTRYRDLFLLPEGKVFETIGRPKSELHLLAHPTAWLHPDVAVDEELPSANPSFQKLATAIAMGEPLDSHELEGNNLHWERWRLE